MDTSQRVSRGFHRIGIFFAALPLVFAVVVMAVDITVTVEKHRRHDQLACAHNYVSTHDLTPVEGDPFAEDSIVTINLHTIGCSDDPQATIGVKEADESHPPFDWNSTLVQPLALIAASYRSQPTAWSAR
jgi:hypothetical protein